MASTAPPAGAPAPSPAPGPAPTPSTAKKTTSPAPAPAPGASGSTEKTTKKKTTKKKAAAPGDGETKKKKTVRKKKQSTKSSGSAASNAALLAAAKSATADLAHSKALSAARRTDPLWYRIEDVLPPATPSSKVSDPHHHDKMASTILPEQIQIVEKALAHNNMTRSHVTPQAMACLLEQARRYAQELLEDAQDYAAHASGLFAPAPKAGTTSPQTSAGPNGIPEPSAKDYMLAAEMRPDHPQAVTAQLPKLNLLAQQVNATPLPPIPPQCYSGVLLPAAPHALTARTFDVVSGSHVAQKMIQSAPTQTKAFAGSMMAASTELKAGAGSSAGGSGTKKSSKPGYGASRGPQIPIKLSSSSSPKPGTTPSAAAPASAPVNKDQ